MAIQYSIARTISGQTGTVVKLFAVNGADTVLYTSDSVTERTNAKGQYLVTWDEASVIPAGDYTQIMFSSSGLPLLIGDRTFLGVAGETATETPKAAVLNTAGRNAIAAAVDVKLTAEHGAGSWAGGGSGGGDNTEVLEAIDSMKSIISEWVALNIPTDVRGFPATIVGGTDVEVSLEVVDSNNDPITEIFGEPVGSVQWLFGMGTSARKARITGSAVWASDLLQITITRAETLDDDDGPRTWMIGVKLTSGELKWVKTGVTRLIGRQFPEPTTTTTGA